MNYIGKKKVTKPKSTPAREQYKHYTSDEANDFKRDYRMLGGCIHTAEIYLPEYEFTNDMPSMATDYGTTERQSVRVRCGVVGTSMKFNPNKRIGGSVSLEAYRNTLNSVLENIAFSGEYTLCRLDFKVDCNPPATSAAFWRKLNDLFVYSFVAYKKAQPKGRERTIDPITGQFKQTKGSTKGFEIVFYNKRLQKPQEGVDYRTELRCIGMNTKETRNYCDEERAIKKLNSIVTALPAYYQQAVDAQCDRMAKLFKEISPSKGSRSPNEFLRTEHDFVFNRKQIKAFALKTGEYNESQAERFAANFVSRNPSVILISQSDLIKLCTVIANCMESYLHS